MATCLQCGNNEARITMSRVVPDRDDGLIQVRLLMCPECGLRGQVIRDTGAAAKLEPVPVKGSNSRARAG